MKAIDTRYAERLFRSRIEARWAVFFDLCGIQWQYEERGFELGNGELYLPDFFLPEKEIFFEVKGAEPDKAALDRCRALADESGFTVVLFAGHMEHYRVFHRDPLSEELLTRFFCQWLTPDFDIARAIAREARFEHGSGLRRTKMQSATVGDLENYKRQIGRPPHMERIAVGAAIWLLAIGEIADAKAILGALPEALSDPGCRTIRDTVIELHPAEITLASLMICLAERQNPFVAWGMPLPHKADSEQVSRIVAALEQRELKVARAALQERLAAALGAGDDAGVNAIFKEIDALQRKLHPRTAS